MGLTWWAFAALPLAPDISMLGYLAGERIDAAAYNAAHTSVLPLGLRGASLERFRLGGITQAIRNRSFFKELERVLIDFGTRLGLGQALIVARGAIWLAHVGWDRMLGYGLKYASSCGDTHLGSLARRPALSQSPKPPLS